MTHSAFDFGLLIDAEQLVPHLGNDKLRIVDLSRASVYDQLHIPHALHLKPKFLVRQDEQATGLLPDVAGLQELIRYLNISPEHHVVVYDDEGGAWAGRLIWNLHCLGFENTSLLNGGIHAWLAPMQPMSPWRSIQAYTISASAAEPCWAAWSRSIPACPILA